MWGDRKVRAVLLNHLSDAKNAELRAPQLSGCPRVHPNAKHVGIPQSFSI